MTNISAQVKGHFLDFDENSNCYLVPSDQYRHFLDWSLEHRLNYQPEAKDLLPGMIPVADLTNVVITDYTIITHDNET